MSDDNKKKLDELKRELDRFENSYQKSFMRTRAWDALDNALGAVKLANDMYGGTKNYVVALEETAKSLEGLGNWKVGSDGQPYSPTFLLHFAIAIRAMTMSPTSAQEYYKSLGQNFVGDVFK